MSTAAIFPDQSPVESLPVFAVALTTCKLPHVGVIFWWKKSVWLLHLAGHNSLKLDKADTALPNRYGWVVPQVPEMELKQLASFARVQAKNKDKNTDIPFSFRYAPPPAEYRYTRGGQAQFFIMHGFTCATFVMSIFDWIMVPLIDHASWTLRPNDEFSQLNLIPYIAQRGASHQHLLDAANEIPCIRFRPQEVAAACLSAARPVNMKRAEELATELDQDMTDFYVRVGVI